MLLRFLHNGEPLSLSSEAEGEGWRVRLPDGSERRIRARLLEGGMLEITEGARTFRVPFARGEQGLELSWMGQTYRFEPEEGRAASRKGVAASGMLAAPMVGVVADVLVRDGQEVEAYQPLVVVEAMKVLATLEAPFAGTVRLHVAKGDRVQHGATLAEVIPLTPESAA